MLAMSLYIRYRGKMKQKRTEKKEVLQEPPPIALIIICKKNISRLLCGDSFFIPLPIRSSLAEMWVRGDPSACCVREF